MAIKYCSIFFFVTTLSQEKEEFCLKWIGVDVMKLNMIVIINTRIVAYSIQVNKNQDRLDKDSAL